VKLRCVLGAVLYVVAAGCVGGSVAGTVALAPVLARAGVPESGRFHLEIVANGTDRDVLLSAVGAFDHRNRRYSLEIGGTTVASLAVPRRTVAVDGVLYLDFPALARRLGAATPWIRVRAGGDDVLGVRALDPVHLLDRLSSTDTTVERGHDGLVRRITTRFDAPGDNDDVVLTVAYFDLGAPVTIEPPPAAQVTDETEEVNGHPGKPTGG
jgi:hypothetical protein